MRCVLEKDTVSLARHEHSQHEREQELRSGPRRHRLLHELAVLLREHQPALTRKQRRRDARTVTLDDPAVLLKKKRGHHSHAASAPAPVVGPAEARA
jgi:hypothetical protein